MSASVHRLLVCGWAGFVLAGCFAMRPSRGGGQIEEPAGREEGGVGIALPAGYRIERVASGLNFPTGVAFDAEGRPCVVESGYAYGEVWTTPRLVRVEDGGRVVEIARGGDDGPWNGVDFRDGSFFVAAGGRKSGGAILRIDGQGAVTRLVENLPSTGDHHVNGPAVGPDGNVYFSIGTATNSGVVGEDSAAFGWLADHPDFHDVPCRDVVLRGANFETRDVRGDGSEARVETGAYSPFGTPTPAGTVIAGKIPCTGAVLRVGPSGGAPELVAWGFRNPFGLAFAPDGSLYATDNSYDVRGSRPVYGTGDLLWRVETDAWYGWPDYHGTRRVDDANFFEAPGHDAAPLLLAEAPARPPEPVAVLPVHSSSDGLDISTNPAFGHVGQAFVAQFGDQAPTVGKVLRPVGFKVVRVDLVGGVQEDFAVNLGDVHGPASKLGAGGLERPVAVRFDPSGERLYVVDFGVLTQDEKSHPVEKTGVLWRIERVGAGETVAGARGVATPGSGSRTNGPVASGAGAPAGTRRGE